METNFITLASDAKPVWLNIGCGFQKGPEGWTNVDAYDCCSPDVLWDLNKVPWPWEDNSVDLIAARHVFEHLENWWGAFKECARILKPGGLLELRVPDSSSDSAITYRDHLTIFAMNSFHGTLDTRKGQYSNAWFCAQDAVPFKIIGFKKVPFKEYDKWWMPNWLLAFCANHLRNFIWEQRFTFQKVKPE